MNSRRPFRVPERLAVSVLVTFATVSCNDSTTTDAGNDANTDVATDLVNDIGTDAAEDVPTPCDAQPYSRGTFQCVAAPGSDAGSCGNRFVCSASMCGEGCVGCAINEATFMYGYACLADGNTDANVDCPPQVCEVADCPSGCHACSSTLFCIPDSTSDVMAASCSPSVVCSDDPLGCQTGCTAVG